MNTSRRLFTMFLIAVSCLFAIQSAAALTAPVPGSSEEACVPIKSLPDNFPDWIEKPTCTFVQSDKNAVASASLCGDTGQLPGNRPQSSVLPAHAGSACLLSQPGNTVAASKDVCATVGPTVFNLGLGSGPSRVAALNAPACVNAQAETSGQSNASKPVDDDTGATSQPPDIVRGKPSNIGPTI